MLTRRDFVKLAGFTVAGLTVSRGLAGQAGRNVKDKPNVIIVMTDDQGYGDLSCHGNPVVKTPHIDQLYASSVRFTDFHVAPMCTPTRGQLLTGRDALNNGAMFVNRRSMIRRDLPTIGDIFRANGYSTGLFGKWHLGDSYPHRPLDRGFDTVVRHGSWGITSIADYFGNDYFDDTYRHNAEYEEYDGYCTDVWFDEAMRWIEGRKKRGERFFCYIPTNIPHGPHWVADRYAEPYKGKGPANFFGMIANLDENMGRLMRFLEEHKLVNNTILIFLTDNGTAAGDKVFNAGMRGKKRSLYEGGHRVPLFIHWPGGAIVQPRAIDALAHVQDVLPTLIDLCQLDASDAVEFDGVSLATLLRGRASKLPDSERMLVVQYGEAPVYGNAAVLWKKWRLVMGKELYLIDEDPGQERNIASEHPQIVQRMQQHYRRWWDNVQATLDSMPRIHLGDDKANPTILYASDWRGDYADNWYNLAQGDRKGVWNVHVARSGLYALTLYRWPPEANTALDASLRGSRHREGRAVPIASASIRIGDVECKADRLWDQSDAPSIRFTVQLQAGDCQLRTMFYDCDGKELCSAYYTRVERL